MRKIGLFLAIALFIIALIPISLTAQPTTGPTPQVLVQEERPEVKFQTLQDLLNDLVLVKRKTFDDKIVYDVEFRSFSFWHVNKIIIEKVVPTEIKTRYAVYRFVKMEFLRFEVNLMESYKTFVFDSKKTYETTNDGIRNIQEIEKSVDIHVSLTVEGAASLNNDEVATMIGKINRAIKEKRPLTFICGRVTLHPFHFDKFDPFSKIDVSLYMQDIKEN
jgi:hypothetical protein